MSKYRTEVNSNILQKGKKLDLVIKVLKENDNGGKESISLNEGDEILIENMNEILNHKNDSVMFSINKRQFNFDYDAGYFYLELNRFMKSEVFEIKIKTKKAFEKDIYGSLSIRIKFKDNDSDQELVVDFVQIETPIEIIDFKSVKGIVQKNVGGNLLEFSYQLKGDSDSLSLSEGNVFLRKLAHEDGEYTSEINFTNKTVNRIYTYTLTLTKKDGQQVSRSINVTYLDESKMGNRLFSRYKDQQKKGKGVDLRLINICGSQHSDMLIALFYHKEIGFKIGYTTEIDGDNWEYVDIDDKEEAIKYYANSPMVHMVSKDDAPLGTVLFVGGSKILMQYDDDFSKYASKVATVKLSTGDVTCKQMMEKNDIEEEMNPIWAHNCIGFKANDTAVYTLYRFGGQNMYGQTNNEIWTSQDGITWSPVEFDTNRIKIGVVTAAGVKLSIESGKNEIWFGGGFESLSGTSLIDMYRLNSKGIEKVTFNRDSNNDVVIPNGLRCFAIATYSVAHDASQGVLFLGFNTKGVQIANDLVQNADNSYSISTNGIKGVENCNPLQNGAINTAFVNGCLYYNVFSDGGAKGINYVNDLFYYIPKLNNETISFFN